MIATSHKGAGASFTSKRLADAVGAILVPTDRSVISFGRDIFRHRSDLYHIQFEYRTFGGVARSLTILPLLTAVLSSLGPVVVTLHGLVTEASLRERHFKRLVHTAFRYSLRATGCFATAFVVHSEEMRKTAEGDYGLHHVSVIPLGSDPPPSGAGARPATHRVVFFGFIRPEKGLNHLLRAIGQLRGAVPDIQLTIAGSVVRSRERGYLLGLQEQVQAEGLTKHVTFLTKFLSDGEIAELMRDAAVLALPYTDRFVEVSAIVHHLAGFGVPLVCSKTPRFSELEDGVECLKATPEPDALAQGILRILTEPALASSLSQGLLRRSKLDSWDHVAARHRDLYRELMRAWSPHHASAV